MGGTSALLSADPKRDAKLFSVDPLGKDDAFTARTEAHVLVVEDQELLREMLLQLLTFGGYRAVGVPNGRAALDYLQDHSHELPCLILLDLMMPVMDGWEFRRAQLADARLAGVPVVILTGLGDTQANTASLRVERVMTKPPSMDQLLAVVRSHCGPGKPDVGA